MPRRDRFIPALLLLALLAGCATPGRQPAPPAPDTPAAWRQAGDALFSASPDAAALARWWRSLNDPLLEELITRALQASPDIRTAQARLREVRARRLQADAGRLPEVSAGFSASRAKSGDADSRNQFSLGLDAAWEVDVFGGIARDIEAAQADLEASAADLEATRVSLAAEVALDYVSLRAAQRRLDIARANLASQAETLQLTRWRAQAGLVNELDVAQARTNLEQTRAQLPSLETSRTEAAHRLAILLGRFPGELDSRLETAPLRASLPGVPARLALGIPADTLRQRPDLRAAERRVAAALARVDAAEAARYPGFKLSGSLGLEALTLGGLGDGGSAARSLLGSLTAPLFNAGRLKQQVEIQDAQREQAQIAYEQALLTALEEVENALTALSQGGRRLEALAEALAAGRVAAQLARQQYAAGLVDFQTVLDTERSLLNLEDSLASAQAQRVTALITLYKALGGGWDIPATADQDEKSS